MKKILPLFTVAVYVCGTEIPASVSCSVRAFQ